MSDPGPAVQPGAFQSAPGGEAGGKWSASQTPVSRVSFQSAPGGEAGGKTAVRVNDADVGVSIRPRR